MLVFVCETVTAGGFVGEDLPDGLIAEGTLMRDALIGDLEDLPGISVVTTHDARLPPPPRGHSTPLAPGEDARAAWNRLAAEAHCCWPIAPETDGILERFVAELRTLNRRVVASDASTLRNCSSKKRTAAILAAAGVATVPTWGVDEVPADAGGPFVVKPDDGAGALDVTVCAGRPQGPYPARAIVQPYVEGVPSSLSLLCQSGRTHVLAANRQNIDRADGRLSFRGVMVGAQPVDDALRALGAKVGAALPGLHGIVGLDYIATPDGPVVVEVNPRLTTSYAGLRQALGVNPLAFVAELIRDGAVPDLPHLPPALPVEVIAR
ncbi:ATP-grasp domain-containing protein [Ancylobacter mangrovi]|uniref:ATP-grasp domain-containing protein n=1 Tax=Ancylobacter mangrovi TaxID=2972472 RepID=UPI00216280AA|nr:ATP-grasp domain-containing protein [Ancylobacter mangrovi]MCS0501124.1 ATP-grasp domain-containing protein [Ancylobacter mangrovi]